MVKTEIENCSKEKLNKLKISNENLKIVIQLIMIHLKKLI